MDVTSPIFTLLLASVSYLLTQYRQHQGRGVYKTSGFSFGEFFVFVIVVISMYQFVDIVDWVFYGIIIGVIILITFQIFNKREAYAVLNGPYEETLEVLNEHIRHHHLPLKKEVNVDELTAVYKHPYTNDTINVSWDRTPFNDQYNENVKLTFKQNKEAYLLEELKLDVLDALREKRAERTMKKRLYLKVGVIFFFITTFTLF
ncbi:hypothetical protein [Texcoconibacillus texcoconensis]|nr:hypothetical protein [Texcoconibacillus texcoconensis]